MANLRRYIPLKLLLWIVGLLILAPFTGPIIQATATEEQLAQNVLLSAIPFVLIFVAIVLVYVAIVIIAANVLNNRISAQIHRPVELATIGGIIVGIIGMFQPWWFGGFRLGFYVLLISTLLFILWSHITPRGENQSHTGSVSVSEFEQTEAQG